MMGIRVQELERELNKTRTKIRSQTKTNSVNVMIRELTMPTAK